MKKITLKRNEDKRIRNGHLWVFSNEIDKIEEGIVNGDLVLLYDSKEGLIGTRSEEHTSELQSLRHLVCRLLLEKKNKKHTRDRTDGSVRRGDAGRERAQDD